MSIAATRLASDVPANATDPQTLKEELLDERRIAAENAVAPSAVQGRRSRAYLSGSPWRPTRGTDMSGRVSSPFPSGARDTLLAAALAHLSTYLETGCARSANLAQLLLRRLDDGAAGNCELLGSYEALAEAILVSQAALRR